MFCMRLILKYNSLFNEFGKRKIKKCKLDISKFENKSPQDMNMILYKLNSKELTKTINYIKIQEKVLKYHLKKNNFDSISIIKDSIKLMKSFKAKILLNEF